jgi:uncharacterized GH25 family protein
MQIKVLSAVAFWFVTATIALGSPPLTLTGKVVDSSGQPLSNATVMVYHAGVRIGYSTFCPSCYADCGKRSRTDATGSYTFKKLNSDLWFELLIVRDGYLSAQVKANDSSNGMAPTAILNLRTPITDPSRVAKGRVTDGAGDAVPDAVVKAEGVEIDKGALIGTIPGLDPLAVTNDNGEFELDYAKPATRMLLSVEARTYAPKFAVLVTGPDRQTIELARGATIRGRLMQDGKPVGNAEVGLIGQARGGFGAQLTIVGTPYSELRVGTQKDGSFALSDVPIQTNWYVYAKMESVASRGATEPKACATTRSDEIVNVGDIQLRPGYHFEGNVLLSDGKPVPEGMRVSITSQRVGDSQTAILDKGGHFTFSSLPEEKYSVSAAVRGYSFPDGGYEVETAVERDVSDFVITLNPKSPAH